MENNYYQNIKNACFSVYNQLGYGLSENAYQTALFYELSEIYNLVQTEYHIPQTYKTTKSNRLVQIADLRIDILIDNKVILELKSISKINNKEILQCQRYKKLFEAEFAFLINFGATQMEFFQF